MNTFNKVLNIIIVAMMVCANVGLAVLVLIEGTGKHNIIMLDYYLLIMIVGTIALLLTPKDHYKGYNPEPDRSKKYEEIQRDLYNKGYDMSKDIEYNELSECDYWDGDETDKINY